MPLNFTLHCLPSDYTVDIFHQQLKQVSDFYFHRSPVSDFTYKNLIKQVIFLWSTSVHLFLATFHFLRWPKVDVVIIMIRHMGRTLKLPIAEIYLSLKLMKIRFQTRHPPFIPSNGGLKMNFKGYLVSFMNIYLTGFSFSNGCKLGFMFVIIIPLHGPL